MSSLLIGPLEQSLTYEKYKIIIGREKNVEVFNILVGMDGSIKLCDFGISRELSVESVRE